MSLSISGSNSEISKKLNQLLDRSSKIASILLQQLNFLFTKTSQTNKDDILERFACFFLLCLKSHKDFFANVWRIHNWDYEGNQKSTELLLAYNNNDLLSTLVVELNRWKSTEEESKSIRLLLAGAAYASSHAAAGDTTQVLSSSTTPEFLFIFDAAYLSIEKLENFDYLDLETKVIQMVNKAGTSATQSKTSNINKTSTNKLTNQRLPMVRVQPKPKRRVLAKIMQGTKSPPSVQLDKEESLAVRATTTTSTTTPLAPNQQPSAVTPFTFSDSLSFSTGSFLNESSSVTSQKGKKKPRYQTIDDIPRNSIYFKCLCQPGKCSKVTLVWPNQNKDDPRVNGAINYMKDSGDHLLPPDTFGRQMIIPTVPRTTATTGISYANGFLRHKQHVVSCMREKMDLKASEKLHREQLPEIFQDYRYCNQGLSEQERRKIERENKKKYYEEIVRWAHHVHAHLHELDPQHKIIKVPEGLFSGKPK